jgi:hypothetical protein
LRFFFTASFGTVVVAGLAALPDDGAVVVVVGVFGIVVVGDVGVGDVGVGDVGVGDGAGVGSLGACARAGPPARASNNVKAAARTIRLSVFATGPTVKL